jgi:hypothetical protein
MATGRTAAAAAAIRAATATATVIRRSAATATATATAVAERATATATATAAATAAAVLKPASWRKAGAAPMRDLGLPQRLASSPQVWTQEATGGYDGRLRRAYGEHI